ncbi:pheromone shutdown protein TraB [Paenibacillus anaericanus]|nr:pheromone shutdown protein TraB [Paenibacillus anaericanus]
MSQMYNNLQYSDICTIFRWANAISAERQLHDKDITTTLKRLLISCKPDQKVMLLECFPSVI